MPRQLQHLIILSVITGVLLLPDTSYGFQKFKLGNGALLRKVFGKEDPKSDDSKEKKQPEKAEPKKSLWPSPGDSKTKSERPSFDETRRKLEEDARRLQEDLRKKFKSPFQNNPQTPSRESKPSLSAYAPTTDPAVNRNGLRSVMDQSQSKPTVNPYIASGRMPRNAGPQNQPRVPAPNRQPTIARSPATNDGQIPAAAAGPGFGIIGRPTAGGGIQVTDVRPDSMADSIGVRRGDVLTSVAGLELSAVEEIDAITNVLQKEDQFEVFFNRNGKQISKMMSGMPTQQKQIAGKLSSNRSVLPLSEAVASNKELIRMQQQLEKQQAMIRQLRKQLQERNASTLPAPSTNMAPPELESDFGMELNLEPPR